MAGRQSRSGELAREALRAHPAAGTLTLAKQLRRDHPKVFHDIEHARSALRRMRGAAGERARRKIRDKAGVRSRREAEACRRWGSLLPAPSKNDWRWHELPAGPKRWLGLADPHIPYHDKASLATALAHADGNCDGILLLGDIGDFYQTSTWERDPEQRSIQEECEMLHDFLDVLVKLRPKKIIYKGGNHEERIDRYINRVAPALKNAPGLNLASWLDLKKRGIDWIPSLHPLRTGKLAVIHGHEWGRVFQSPVNPARGSFLRAHECVLSAHCHRTSQHVETSAFGEVTTCFSVGCLCDLHPRFLPLNRWNHGFFYIDRRKGGWQVENYRIIKGEVRT